ncbi:MAG: PilT/PilU family type 4a pilus ATPase [Verrucomicrobiota bacterium]|nr:PilT/PilU family type 4a pilus ATPase [Verrucomicrobiota bacterium]
MAITKMHDVLDFGVKEGASDWHIREGSTVALRVGGKLIEIDFMTDADYLKEFMDDIATDKIRKEYEEDGDSNFALVEDDVGRFRVNLHRQRGFLSMTLRHVKDEVPDVDALGLPKTILGLSESKNGIIFVTGATGSGKSTTLACMIEHMNRNTNRHLVTIEDPIEYNFKDKNCIIEQREVGLDTISFDSAMRNALRQDPDVIMVGELRNRDSFESALAASETGHLVMTTLHTSNAAQSINRILDFYPKDEREGVRKGLAENLRAIICQRLIPKASGKGVLPINEILINTPIVTKLLFENKLDKLEGAIRGGKEEGMITFNNALLDLVNEGMITEETALSFASNKESLKMNLQGIFLNEDGGILG